jgi:hypothetical protein
MKAIEKDPDKRFQTGGEFREVLMNAGYAASGTMHGMTGTHAARPATTPSHPPADFSQDKTIVNPATPSLAGIKETRLGAPAATAAAPAPSAMKATRFSANHEAAVPVMPVAPQQGGSFFSKLGVVHYAAAGVVILLLIVGVVAIPLLLMAGSKGAPAANTVETKKNDTAAEKPQIVTPPSSQSAETPMQTSSQSVPQGGGELTPVEDKPADKPVATSKQPAAQRPAAPAPKQPKQNKAKLLEKMATGN